MLRDRYEPQKLFELVSALSLKMEPVLARLDKLRSASSRVSSAITFRRYGSTSSQETVLVVLMCQNQ
jgi:hypothetical protein